MQSNTRKPEASAVRPVAILWCSFAFICGVVCAFRSLKAVDLHVYHAAARSYFLLSGSMYGPNQDFGWPMIYRYPPLFMCLFHPFAHIPFPVAVGLWASLKILMLGLLVTMWYRRHPPKRPGVAFALAGLILLPYWLYEMQVGNVQSFMVEIVCFALLLCDEKPLVSSVLLGLAGAVKIWPGFVLPFMAVRGAGHRRVALQSLAAGAAWSLLPAIEFGWSHYYSLLSQWYSQELRINALLGDRWYPSQSLRGVMLRYLTRMDYSGLPDSNYRHVNFVSLPSWEVRQFWLVLAVTLGLLALFWVYRCANHGAAYSVFFCSLLLTEPNVQRIAYVALLWPVLVAGGLYADHKMPKSAKWMLMGAAALSVLCPLFPGAQTQRLAQVLGIDIFGVLMPLTLVHLICSSPEAQSTLRKTGPRIESRGLSHQATGSSGD